MQRLKSLEGRLKAREAELNAKGQQAPAGNPDIETAVAVMESTMLSSLWSKPSRAGSGIAIEKFFRTM